MEFDQDKRDQILIFEGGDFLHNVHIEGIIAKIDTLASMELGIDKGVLATLLKKDTDEKDRRKGFIYVDGGSKRLVFLGDKLKTRLGDALEPFLDSPIFPFLFEAVSSENIKEENDQEFKVFECEKCGKGFLVHVTELTDKNSDTKLCRECGHCHYKSVTDVPFGTPLLLDAYYTLFEFLSGNSSIPIEKIGKIITSTHPIESGVVRAALRDKLEEIYQPQKDKYNKVLEQAINEAQQNNPKEFNKLVNNLDSLSSKESLQTTSDIARITKQIRETFGDAAFELMFPNPRRNIYEGVDIGDIIQARLSDILNLYKDIYDLHACGS